jgi:hypothetical protein
VLRRKKESIYDKKGVEEEETEENLLRQKMVEVSRKF